MSNRRMKARTLSVLVFSCLGVWLATNSITLAFHMRAGEWGSVALEGVGLAAMVGVFVLLLVDIHRTKGG